MNHLRALVRRHRRRLLLGSLLVALAFAPRIGEALGLCQPCTGGLCRITAFTP